MKKNKSLRISALFILSLLSLWEILYIINPGLEKMIPSFWSTLKALYELTVSGVLLKYIVASLFRITVGFYIAFLFAVPLGLLLGRVPLLNQSLNGFIQFLRPISPLAWIPIAMIWFGIGDKPAIFLIFLSCFFPILISTISAVQNISMRYFQVGANFNFTKWEKVKFVLIPAILPEIVTAIRVSVGIGWMVVVAAEMIAVKSGLGYLIIDARNALRMDQVLAAMFVIGVIGLILDRLILRIENIEQIKWKRDGR